MDTSIVDLADFHPVGRVLCSWGGCVKNDNGKLAGRCSVPVLGFAGQRPRFLVLSLQKVQRTTSVGIWTIFAAGFRDYVRLGGRGFLQPRMDKKVEASERGKEGSFFLDGRGADQVHGIKLRSVLLSRTNELPFQRQAETIVSMLNPSAAGLCLTKGAYF